VSSAAAARGRYYGFDDQSAGSNIVVVHPLALLSPTTQQEVFGKGS
jgi:hypothetical protein